MTENFHLTTFANIHTERFVRFFLENLNRPRKKITKNQATFFLRPNAVHRKNSVSTRFLKM